jgi:hypothetical protein
MSFPPPQVSIIPPSNPLEGFIASFNTNSYFIGVMMILLNLGGRHLATGLTVEQDKIFQNVWFRRFLLFIVIFIATRNIFAAFWLSISVMIILGFLTNETSSLYLFGDPVNPPKASPSPDGLSPEEAEIYRRLHDRVMREREKEKPTVNPVQNNTNEFLHSYVNVMRTIHGVNIA